MLEALRVEDECRINLLYEAALTVTIRLFVGELRCGTYSAIVTESIKPCFHTSMHVEPAGGAVEHARQQIAEC